MCKRWFILIWFISLAGAGACQAVRGPAPAVEPGVAPDVTAASASPQPTPWATATPLPAAPTPTPWARPTTVNRAPPLQPTTAAPLTITVPGMYRNDLMGMALHYPPSWQMVWSDESSAILREPLGNLGIFAFGGFHDSNATIDGLVQDLVHGWDGGAGTLTIAAQETITMDSGLTGTLSHLEQAMAGTGDEIDQLFVAIRGPRFVALAIMGTDEGVAMRQASLHRLYTSLELFTPSLFGLDRSQAIVQLGYEPLPWELDPAQALDGANGYAGLIFSGLVRLAPDLSVEPDLAAGWEIGPGGDVYTFTLRPNITFADGRALTAADVQYSWERAASPELDSATAQTYLGDIAGFANMHSGAAESLAGVQMVDELTLVVRLAEPVPYFLAKLTYPTSFVVDRHNVTAGDDEWVRQANASGPFTLQEWREEEALIFGRNERYHAPTRVPLVVYLLFRFGSSLSLYESGEVDITWVPQDQMAAFSQGEHRLADQVQSNVAMCTTMLLFNNSQPPFEDPLVRRAFALAVDPALYNERIMEDTGVVAQTVLPPAMPGYQPPATLLAPDAEAARDSLAASSYAGGLPPVVLNAGGYGDSDPDYVTLLAQMWRDALGAEVQIVYLDPDEFSHAARAEHGHIVSFGWCADYPDPANFLDILFHSSSEFNLAGYANPAVDALLVQARTEQDAARRLALYHELETALLQDTAVVPLVHSVNMVLVQPRVQGYALTPLGVPQLHRLSIATDSGEGG